jgi:DNA (cytosine-5)-methyltransferase 1
MGGAGVILELFAGPGGWDLGYRALGCAEPIIGLEHDKAACATRATAGFLTIQADVSTYPTAPFVGKVSGIIASPPCPDFSAAGKHLGIHGSSGHLIFEVLRWVLALRPTWVACEQVPAVLPWWKLFAEQMRREGGYKTWEGILCAADVGVPQERYRAFLLASLDQQPQPPAATHAEHPGPESLFGGPTLLPWVSMAEGLGWGMTKRPYITVTTGGNGGADPMLTVEEALILQGCEPDFPVQGSRTKKFEQIGNMIPPPWAAAILRQFMDRAEG